MSITIYHNPKCGTARNTLAMIRQPGEEPVVIEYLKTPPAAAIRKALFEGAGFTVRGALRQKGTPMTSWGSGVRNGPTVSCSISWKNIRS